MTGNTSASGTVRLTPPGQDKVPEAERVSYLIQRPSVYDKAAYRRRVKERGVRLAGTDEMHRAMQTDIDAMLKQGRIAADAARALEKTLAAYGAVIDAATAAVKAGEEIEPPDEKMVVAFGDFEEAVRDQGGEYARLLAGNEYFLEISMIEGVRMFVTGWENKAAECEVLPVVGLSEQSVSQIPDAHMVALDARIGELLAPSEDAEKNSASPPLMSSTPGTSRTAKSTPKKTRPRTKASGRSRK